MQIFQRLKRRYRRARYGLDTRTEFVLSSIGDIITSTGGKLITLGSKIHRRHLRKFMGGGNSYCLKDVRLPVVGKDEEGTMRLINLIDEDIFCSYLHFGDDYSEKTFDVCEGILGEGLYGLVNGSVNVTVKPGDIVIDAGSCCGSFSAYASVKGAEAVYAFEPVAENFAYLERTASLNKNIHPVNKGLSDENTSRDIFIDPGHFSGSSFLEELKPGIPGTQVETVRLDDFVRENNLPRVDFIKADIEGFERHMLAGAQETLARFAPKLALCTYHLPDDPEVMTGLIKKANPRYNIVQKRMKLFASVPQE